MSLECQLCGIAIESTHHEGWFWMDDDVDCPDCGAEYIANIDGESDDPSENTAYLTLIRCGHGIDIDEPCEECT